MTKSDEWDRREKIKERLNHYIPKPFNLKFLILIGLVIFTAVFAYAYYMLPFVYAEGEGCPFIVASWSICFNQLNDRLDRIEKKLDWQNCAISHKSAYNYAVNGDSFIVSNDDRSNTLNELIDQCGDLPITELDQTQQEFKERR